MSGNSTGCIVSFVKCHIFILCDLWRNLKYIELTFICDKSRFCLKDNYLLSYNVLRYLLNFDGVVSNIDGPTL